MSRHDGLVGGRCTFALHLGVEDTLHWVQDLHQKRPDLVGREDRKQRSEQSEDREHGERSSRL